MEYRRLGSSDVKVSVVTLGTWAVGAWAIGGWMWGGQDESDALAAIAKAVDLGVTTIDTAAIYGYGYSEEVVGKAVAGKRDKVQLLTKYGLRWDSDEGTHYFDWTDPATGTKQIYRNARKESVIYECEQSLKRLGTDYIDVYQCHWRDKSTPIAETMEAIDQLLEAGKIRAAGVSNFSVEDMAAANKVVPLASSQPPYSMVNRPAEADIIPWCQANDVGVIVYSPLQRGLLTGKITPGYKFNEGDHRRSDPFFQPDTVRKVNAFLDEIRPIAEAHDATLAQLVISWTIARPGITAALVGARNAKQAEENAKAAEVKLTAQETRQIDELLDDLKIDV